MNSEDLATILDIVGVIVANSGVLGPIRNLRLQHYDIDTVGTSQGSTL